MTEQQPNVPVEPTEVKVTPCKLLKYKKLLIILGVFSLLILLSILILILILSSNTNQDDGSDNVPEVTITATPEELPTVTPIDEAPSHESIIYCPNDYKSTEKCILSDEDGQNDLTNLDGTYAYYSDIAYKADGGKFLIYKLNGTQYSLVQEYDLPFGSSWGKSIFPLDNYIYLYQSRMADLDGEGDYYFGDPEIEYNNDTEGILVRFGVQQTITQELKRIRLMNTLSPGDILGEGMDIDAVDEGNTTLYYHDPAGGGFFHSIYKYNWESKVEEEYDMEEAGMFVAMAPDFSHLYYAGDYFDNLIKSDFRKEYPVITDNVYGHIDDLFFTKDNTLIFYESDYRNGKVTLYSVDVENHSNKICEIDLNGENIDGRMQMGLTNGYLDISASDVYSVNLSNCNKTKLSIPEGYRFIKVLVY